MSPAMAGTVSNNAPVNDSATDRLRENGLNGGSNGTRRLPARAPAVRFRAASWQE
jgi:hypothetical protein